jgi:hypothetical protein
VQETPEVGSFGNDGCVLEAETTNSFTMISVRSPKYNIEAAQVEQDRDETLGVGIEIE